MTPSLKRILSIVALTVLAVVAFWTLLYFSSPRHAAKNPAGKPVPIRVLPAPARP